MNNEETYNKAVRLTELNKLIKLVLLNTTEIDIQLIEEYNDLIRYFETKN